MGGKCSCENNMQVTLWRFSVIVHKYNYSTMFEAISREAKLLYDQDVYRYTHVSC